MQDDLLKTDADFVVSKSLTTPGAGYNSLHHWLGRTIPPAKPTPCKFKLSKISRKIYEKNSGLVHSTPLFPSTFNWLFPLFNTSFFTLFTSATIT